MEAKAQGGTDGTPVNWGSTASSEVESKHGIARFLKSDKCKNVITMAGAGISTSAGIPDFRSPGSGLYDNLHKYNLPTPTSIFDVDFYKENPEPFCQLAKDLWPGGFKPTPCHYFIKQLNDKGKLLRHYTQNIDGLELLTGIPLDKVVEAHGHFRSAHCIQCQTPYTEQWLRGFNKCDLLIIMGTSLSVQPFSSLPQRVSKTTPRLLMNMDKENTEMDPFIAMFMGGCSMDFDSDANYRDVFKQGACDDSCIELSQALGWGDELKATVGGNATKESDAKCATEMKLATSSAKASASAPQTKPTSTLTSKRDAATPTQRPIRVKSSGKPARSANSAKSPNKRK